MKMPLQSKERFWDGRKNKVIRYYFYTQRGLALLNEFRYLIMAVLAIYALLKLENPLLMPIMFLVSLPVLMVLGWISVHHMSRVMDFLNIQFATHFSKYNIELQEEQLKELKKINNENIKKDNN